jgi:hypothetical protein
MKCTILFLMVCTLAVSADISFVVDKTDPALAGMNPAMLAKIPVRMKEFVDAGKTAGVVTLVARHGRVASLEAVGFQDLEKKIPMRVDSIFRMASITKPITCAAVMVLVDDGRLSLLDPVEKFVPEFKGLKVNPCGTQVGHNCEAVAALRPVNVLDLMTHTSGLGSAGGGGGRGRGGAPAAPPNSRAEQVAASLLNIQLSQKLLQAKELEAFQTMSAFFVHDLKNTASTLSLMLQNLPTHFEDPAFRADALRAVGKSVERINALISRVGLLRQTLAMNLKEADVNEVVNAALSGLETVHQTALIMNLSPVPKIRIDAEQIQKAKETMRHCIQNLIGIRSYIVGLKTLLKYMGLVFGIFVKTFLN